MEKSLKASSKKAMLPWVILYAAACVGFMLLPLPLLSRLFFVLSASNFFFCAVYYGNIYNLPGIFATIFLLQIACSQAKLTAVEQADFGKSTWIVLLSVLAAFYVVVFVFNKLFHLKKRSMTADFDFRLVPSVLLFLNIACLVIEAVFYIWVYSRLGTLPLFDDVVRARTLPRMIGNFGTTFMVLPQFMVMLNMAYCVKNRKYWLSLFSIVFLGMLITTGARINVFIPTLVCLVTILIGMYQYKKRFWELFAVAAMTCVVVVALMVSIPMLRTGSYVPSDSDGIDRPGGTTTGESYYVTIYSDASMNRSQKDVDPNYGVKLPAAVLPIWVNFSTELHAFNNMVTTLDQTHDYQYGKCFLTGTLNFLFKSVVEKPDSTELSNIDFITVCTFLMEPYHDFGVIGAALFVALYMAAGLYLYKRMMEKRTLFSVLYYSYFCMIAVMFIFANHIYYSTFVVNTIIIALCCWMVSVDWWKLIFRRGGKRAVQ